MVLAEHHAVVMALEVGVCGDRSRAQPAPCPARRRRRRRRELRWYFFSASGVETVLGTLHLPAHGCTSNTHASLFTGSMATAALINEGDEGTLPVAERDPLWRGAPTKAATANPERGVRGRDLHFRPRALPAASKQRRAERPRCLRTPP